MKQILVSSLLASLLWLSFAPQPCRGEGDLSPSTEAWTLAHDEEPLEGVPDVLHTSWVTRRPPGGIYDRIQVHRYRSAGEAQAALLYFPGTWMNGQIAIQEERYNLWLFLARRGVEVFTLDYRTNAVPPETDDLSPLRHWNVESFVADAAVAARWVRQQSGQPSIFVAGFSRGVFFAYAHAAAEPLGVAGVVALDGYFKHSTPQPETDLEGLVSELEKKGDWASALGRSRGWQARQALMGAAAANPEGPALGGKDEKPSRTVGAQLAEILYKTWGPGGLANPLEGPSEGVSRIQILARLLEGYDRFYPKVQDLQGRAFGNLPDDPRTTLDDGWPKLEMPVIFFGSTGMGPDFLLHGIASAAHCAGRRAEIHVLEGHGHLDILVGEASRSEVFEPTLDWILRISPLRETSNEKAPGTTQEKKDDDA